MLRRFLRLFGNDSYIQALSDYFGNISEGNTFFVHGVIPGSGGTLLKRQPVETSSVEYMHGSPTIGAVTDIGGHALVAGILDEGWNEAVVALPVYGGRKANQRHAHASIRQRARSLFRHNPGEVVRSEDRGVFFARETAGCYQRRS